MSLLSTISTLTSMPVPKKVMSSPCFLCHAVGLKMQASARNCVRQASWSREYVPLPEGEMSLPGFVDKATNRWWHHLSKENIALVIVSLFFPHPQQQWSHSVSINPVKDVLNVHSPETSCCKHKASLLSLRIVVGISDKHLSKLAAGMRCFGERKRWRSPASAYRKVKRWSSHETSSRIVLVFYYMRICPRRTCHRVDYGMFATTLMCCDTSIPVDSGYLYRIFVIRHSRFNNIFNLCEKVQCFYLLQFFGRRCRTLYGEDAEVTVEAQVMEPRT